MLQSINNDSLWLYKNSQGLQTLNEELEKCRERRRARYRVSTPKHKDTDTCNRIIKNTLTLLSENPLESGRHPFETQVVNTSAPPEKAFKLSHVLVDNGLTSPPPSPPMSCKEKIDNEVTYPDIPTPALPKHNVSNQNSNKYSYESEKKVLGPLPMEQTIVAANNQSDFRNHLSNTSSTLLKSEPAKCIDSLQTNSHVKKQVYTVLSSKYALYSPQLSPEISIHDNGGMFSQDTQQEIVPAKPPARVPMKKQVSFSDELVYIHEYDDRIAYKPEYNEFYKEIKANTLPTRNTYEEREQYSTWIKHKPYHPSPHAPHPPQRLSSKLLNVFQPTKVLSQEKITNTSAKSSSPSFPQPIAQPDFRAKAAVKKSSFFV